MRCVRVYDMHEWITERIREYEVVESVPLDGFNKTVRNCRATLILRRMSWFTLEPQEKG